MQWQAAMCGISDPGLNGFELSVLEQLVCIPPKKWIGLSIHFTPINQISHRSVFRVPHQSHVNDHLAFVPSLERSLPPYRGQFALGHRQLRRHFRPGFPGSQGSGPQPGADGIVGVVDFDWHRVDGFAAELDGISGDFEIAIEDGCHCRALWADHLPRAR